MNIYLLLSIVLGGLALALSIFALGSLYSLQKLRKTFFEGKNGAQLEEFIVNQNKKINELAAQTTYIEEALSNMRESQKLALQKMGVVRYNPFQDNGGNLSFSIALMDEHNNGVVITSMHGRESSRVYAKPIKSGVSEFSLTEEEKNAINNSKIINNL